MILILYCARSVSDAGFAERICCHFVILSRSLSSASLCHRPSAKNSMIGMGFVSRSLSSSLALISEISRIDFDFNFKHSLVEPEFKGSYKSSFIGCIFMNSRV